MESVESKGFGIGNSEVCSDIIKRTIFKMEARF
jgi:hypothetical protein